MEDQKDLKKLSNQQQISEENEEKFDNSNSKQDKEQEDINYYQESCKLYIANVVLTTQLKELIAEKNELQSKISKIEQKNQTKIENLNENDSKKKRHRRGAQEIDRPFQCPLKTCQKSYGSEGSLTQHIKIKHADQYTQIIQELNQGNILQQKSGKEDEEESKYQNDDDSNSENNENSKSSV